MKKEKSGSDGNAVPMKAKNANKVIQNQAAADAPPEGRGERYLEFCRLVAAFPSLSLDRPQRVDRRIGEYFDLCARWGLRPTASGLALALGLDRRRLAALGMGGADAALPTKSLEAIRRAYQRLELLWEQYMLNGDISPTAGIFLGKNHFAYADKGEPAPVPGEADGKRFTVDELRRKALRMQAGLADDGE